MEHTTILSVPVISLHLRGLYRTGLILAVVILAACQPVQTLTPALQVSPTKLSTKTPIPTATIIRTPPALPETFQSARLNSIDMPRTYIQDTCQYLKDKWDVTHAKPGTVVMVIMFQSITKYKVESNDGITVKDFDKLMTGLKGQGFKAIDTQQLAGFLYHNENIPWRSVLLLQDGRRHADNFTANFRVYWQEWGWPVVNAWPSLPATSESLWQENIILEKEGWVDHQAYGVSNDIGLSDKSSDESLQKELKGSITAFEKKFDKKPIAFIWPAGSFGKRPVKAARELGYQLGFTMNARGPVLYNWIPLADIEDSGRPSYSPEGKINDPLMTLPRYWASQALRNMDNVRVIGEEATAFAAKNKEIELEYYDIVCAPQFGLIPAVAP
jgi:hypothetical protein